MDFDRKSAVSSFYGGRRPAQPQEDYASPPPTSQPFDPRSRRDSSSSFFNPNAPARASTELLRTQPAPYDRGSYYDTGRQEPVKGGYDEEERLGGNNDAGWDVYADFNNAGPRYSTAFGLGNDASYQPLSPQHTLTKGDDASTTGPVELVTVPAFGPEWKKDELKDMTKRGRKEKKAEDRARKWKAFNRGQYGLLGRKWLTRKVLVFVLFGLCAAVGVVLAFTIPRVPGFGFNFQTPLIGASGSFNNSIPAEFSRAPANFSFPAVAELQVDTNSNFLPLTFKHLDAQVYDLDSLRQVGEGHLSHFKLSAKTFSNIQLPLNFTYLATNDTDQTWTNWYNACKNKALYSDGSRPGLRFRLVIDMNIAGLPGKHSTSTTVTNAPCPIQLSLDSA
ncbi:hypothetical protein FA95DRAFT_1489196 [Auriscalpium vulgare]|uniref:Uncharacterized protein n=1 Tax=Auriscalpium vulgare TaxID=40419 RepID=A0ACB8S018_9AGAM|nr:hypothetical protein FA95DRAFT_1489196 [Auriscalpium vulgare]